MKTAVQAFFGCQNWAVVNYEPGFDGIKKEKLARTLADIDTFEMNWKTVKEIITRPDNLIFEN